MIPPLSLLWRPGPTFGVAEREIAAAFKDGRLKRGPWAICGAMPTHAHHADYSKPLEVVFLCPHHHTQLHHRLRAEFRQSEDRKYTRRFHDDVLREFRREFQEPLLFF